MVLSDFLDPVLLARIQFAFTVSFHIIFPAFTIGLSGFLAFIEYKWLRTQQDVYLHIYRFWIKIFSITFGMGVVSGVVMSYELGTNWSVFSDRISNVLGPLLGEEVLSAFFLEASFLGVMLFGWGRVTPRMHFISTCIVAIGTTFSAFWILSANSWMQTPQGFEMMADGRLAATSWMEVIFNPSFPHRFFHMLTAGYLTTAFVIGGVSAYYLWSKRHIQEAQSMMKMAFLSAAFLSPIQVILGDLHGLNTFKHQPAKVAAIEGIWDNEKNAPLRIFAIPREKEERNTHEILIPNGASWLLTHRADGEIKGLKSWKREDRPPVAWVFWSFRVMVGIGILMLILSWWSCFLYRNKKIWRSNLVMAAWMGMTPSGFIAVLAGWFVTEIGRQPYVVYGVLRTNASVSPAIVGPQVAFSLLCFILVYVVAFGSGTYYILKLIQKGIATTDKIGAQHV